jgi:peptidoglycan/LPS O-acetylase OafA/YrhL
MHQLMTKSNKLLGLEALRGFATLSVFFHHPHFFLILINFKSMWWGYD